MPASCNNTFIIFCLLFIICPELPLDDGAILLLFHVCEELFFLSTLLSQKVFEGLFEADFVVVDNSDSEDISF
jgi:hypothetical protein